MASKLYIGNLAFSATEDQLNDEFSKFGTVESVKIIMDRETGRSKGFGFIEMSTSEEAQEAISQLDGKEFVGRQLRVNEAKPQEKRSRGGFDNNRGRGSRW